MFKRILAAFDGSPEASRALDEAVEFARMDPETTLFVGVAYDAISLESNVFHQNVADIFSTISDVGDGKEQYRKEIEEIKKHVPEDIDVRLLVKVGSAGTAIRDMAAEKDCDLIVMGSRGFTGMKSFFFSSVSGDVVSHVKCPVLIVK